MNRKILMSAVSIITALSLAGGATFAFFSSNASSTGNVFSTGNLILLLDDNNETTPVAEVTASFGDTLVPGDSTSGFISLHNGGSIDIAKVKLGGTETVTSSPDLAGQLNITSAKIGDDQACETNPVDIGSQFTTLAALNGTTIDLNNSNLAAGATKYLCMTFTLASNTDDTFQGKSITEKFAFEGDQDLSQ